MFIIEQNVNSKGEILLNGKSKVDIVFDLKKYGIDSLIVNYFLTHYQTEKDAESVLSEIHKLGASQIEIIMIIKTIFNKHLSEAIEFYHTYS